MSKTFCQSLRSILSVVVLLLINCSQIFAAERLRLIVETDAGGDPDDEQSMVRFLVYVNEWDVEGIIANRSRARDGENRNAERTGLGIVRQLVHAYGQCHSNLVQHDRRFPTFEHLWQRTVAGHNETEEAVNLIIAAVDKPDPRPVWYSDWGTDHGAATNNLKRALDRVRKERGQGGYEKFKGRLRLSSADAFGEHTTAVQPPFRLWVDTFRPELERRRWYHRFSALTATAGGFDLKRDVLTGHGPLGALYPTNTTHWQKEGDTATFLYLVPTGMNEPEQPAWGSWVGRYGLIETNQSSRAYYWANQFDLWQGSTNRDNTLRRWAVDLQNDFKARMDWCVKPFAQANHAPVAAVQGALHRTVASGAPVRLSAEGSRDPDGNALSYEWFVYPEAGSFQRSLAIQNPSLIEANFVAPIVSSAQTVHVILRVTDDGEPPLARYQRLIIRIEPGG
jgi:hypothetical protein